MQSGGKGFPKSCAERSSAWIVRHISWAKYWGVISILVLVASAIVNAFSIITAAYVGFAALVVGVIELPEFCRSAHCCLRIASFLSCTEDHIMLRGLLYIAVASGGIFVCSYVSATFFMFIGLGMLLLVGLLYCAASFCLCCGSKEPGSEYTPVAMDDTEDFDRHLSPA